MNEDGLGSGILVMWDQIAAATTSFVPRLVTALVVILIGFILAAIVRRVLLGVFRRSPVQSFLRQIKIKSVFERLGFEIELGVLFARVAYVLVLVLFLQVAVDFLGLQAVSDALRGVLTFLPKVLGAAFILLAGILFARLVEQVVTKTALDSGVEYGKSIGRLANAVLIFTAFVMAISQLDIDTALIRSLARIVVAGLMLGAALTFGFGARDVTRNLVAGYYLRKVLRPGDDVEVGEVSGKLVAVTPAQTAIRTGERVVLLENCRLLEEVTKS